MIIMWDEDGNKVLIPTPEEQEVGEEEHVRLVKDFRTGERRMRCTTLKVVK